ncbi:hypothetical protein ABLV49_09020 [Polaromonas hydrogenivorans]|uniref:Phage protein n=2 Tax=Polaromonas hydrogenivorans TaxID=335476 RepID=A0AAU7LWE2_9BURK
MKTIIFPTGETLSRPNGEFCFSPLGGQIYQMEPVEETRRARLRMLVTRHNNTMADLCQELGYARTETATLTRILNANVRHDRDGKPYNMGSPMAREIEKKLKLPNGWMDTPPSYAELHGEQDQRAMMMDLMNSLPPEDLATALRMLSALKEPTGPLKNGTEH